ncbi:MAG: hypothetical protein QF415_12000 [Candidatus Undinarchaeales archaeon]|jgi:hypothetical protein|nr:hypothetical protein [Candidatus Undinarchaeales archaeon]MDP7492696.1 hypothetical protein [Candidatus Undinarchaeales archaeon]
MKDGGWEAIEEELISLELKLQHTRPFEVTVDEDEDVHINEVLDASVWIQRLFVDEVRLMLFIYLHPRATLNDLYRGVELDNQRLRLILRRVKPLLKDDDGHYSVDVEVLQGTELWDLLQLLEGYYFNVKRRFHHRELVERRNKARRSWRDRG